MLQGSRQLLSPIEFVRCIIEEGVETFQTSLHFIRLDFRRLGNVLRDPHRIAAHVGGGVSPRDTMLPLHLLSATSEAQVGLSNPVGCSLQLKLASSPSSDPRDSSSLSRVAAADHYMYSDFVS